jgi:hypothetical protein
VAAKFWLPRFMNTERTFHFIEKPERFSGPQVLAQYPAQSPAPMASYGDGVGRRSFLKIDYILLEVPLHFAAPST